MFSCFSDVFHGEVGHRSSIRTCCSRDWYKGGGAGVGVGGWGGGGVGGGIKGFQKQAAPHLCPSLSFSLDRVGYFLHITTLRGQRLDSENPPSRHFSIFFFLLLTAVPMQAVIAARMGPLDGSAWGGGGSKPVSSVDRSQSGR